MPASIGHVLSDNKIVQGGLAYWEGVLAGAAVTPGSLVVRGADDEHVVEAGDASALVLGVADVIFTERVTGTRGGQSVDEDVPEDEPLRLAKGNFLFKGTLSTGDLTRGARLTAAAGGALRLAAVNEPVYAILEKSTDASGGATATLMRYIGGGFVGGGV